MASKQILVTGGTGYIGSHTAVELIDAGYDVVIIDDLSHSSIDTLDGIEKICGKKPAFEKVDMADEEALKAFFKQYPKIDGVIHFAAYKAVGESVQKPLSYYRNNLCSLINLLDCMNELEIAPIVFSSSCTVYGQPDILPVTEKSPIKKAESPYGNSKKICEDILIDTIASGSDLRAIALRYFNPIGAHESAAIGEAPQGIPNNLIPFITQTVAGVREQLSVFGGDWDTPDGTCVRDYIHVVDLAKAHVIAIERLLTGKYKEPYEVFNLGTGKGSTVLEVINTFDEANGTKIPYQIVDRRDGDIEQTYADTRYANEELGWKAELGLAEMLKSAWEWEKHFREQD